MCSYLATYFLRTFFLPPLPRLYHALLWPNLHTACISLNFLRGNLQSELARRHNRSQADKSGDCTTSPLRDEMIAVMENSTSTAAYEWEYYYYYYDPEVVDESKLKYNKYSIVIVFWIMLAAFVGFLFLCLNLMSRSGNLPRSHRSKLKGGHRISTT